MSSTSFHNISHCQIVFETQRRFGKMAPPRLHTLATANQALACPVYNDAAVRVVTQTPLGTRALVAELEKHACAKALTAMANHAIAKKSTSN